MFNLNFKIHSNNFIILIWFVIYFVHEINERKNITSI